MGRSGERDAFLIELDDAGDLVWAQGFDPTIFQHVLGLGASPSGTVYATGHYKGIVDLGGGPLPDAGELGAMYLGAFAP